MSPDERSPRAPKHLGIAGRALWSAIQHDFCVTDAAGLALLTAACEARDRSETARTQIEADGLTFRDSKGHLRPHPLLPVERDARAACIAALRYLNLDIEPALATQGRPSGGSKGKLALVKVG